MAADDYAPPTTGTLKLKGVQSSKVSKKKKKKSKPHPDQPKAAKGSATPDPPPAGDDPDPPADAPADANPALPPANRDSAGGASIGKTEAEIRHDEMRRKRVSVVVPSLSSRGVTERWYIIVERPYQARGREIAQGAGGGSE